MRSSKDYTFSNLHWFNRLDDYCKLVLPVVCERRFGTPCCFIVDEIRTFLEKGLDPCSFSNSMRKYQRCYMYAFNDSTPHQRIKAALMDILWDNCFPGHPLTICKFDQWKEYELTAEVPVGRYIKQLFNAENGEDAFNLIAQTLLNIPENNRELHWNVVDLREIGPRTDIDIFNDFVQWAGPLLPEEKVVLPAWSTYKKQSGQCEPNYGYFAGVDLAYSQFSNYQPRRSYK